MDKACHWPIPVWKYGDVRGNLSADEYHTIVQEVGEGRVLATVEEDRGKTTACHGEKLENKTSGMYESNLAQFGSEITL